MHELFRLRIAAKRQMTAPQRLMELLHLSEGDEIQLEVADGQIIDARPCKPIPTALLSEDLLTEIKKQERRIEQGKGPSLEDARRQIVARKQDLEKILDLGIDPPKALPIAAKRASTSDRART